MKSNASNQPLVSIIVVCYNHQNYVIKCLNSIKNQTYGNIELVVIDSFSTDKSVALIEQWIAQNEIECTFVKRESTFTLTQNLNLALNLINGKYYQGISSDDALLPQKIEAQVKVLESANALVSTCFCGIVKVDAYGNTLGQEMHCRTLKYQDFRLNLKLGSVYYSAAALHRVDAVKQIGGYDEVLFYEDWDLALRLSKQYKFIELPEFLVRYRFHSESMTETYYLDKCLSVVRISMREFETCKDELLLNRAISFSRKVLIAEKRISYRLLGILEKINKKAALKLVMRIYSHYFNQKSKYLSQIKTTI